MFRSKLVLASITAVFLLCCQVQAADPTPISWDGEGDGHLWSDEYNWSSNIVPDNNDIEGKAYAVTINAGVDEVDIGLQYNRTINQLDCYGKVDLESWGWHELTLVDPCGLTNHGYLGIGGIEIIGNVTNYSGATLDLWELEIDANLHNLAGAVIVAESENDVEGDLQNDGTLIIIHASDLLCDSNLCNNGQINLYGGECGVDQILDNNSTGVIRGFGVLYVEQQLQNQGEIIAYGGSLAIRTNYMDQNGTLSNTPVSSLQIDSPNDIHNYGTINVNAGGGVAFASTCNLVNESGGIIELRGGTLAATAIWQQAGASFVGFGSITITGLGLLIQSGATIELTGPTNIIGDVSIASGATLVISAGQTLITGHTTNYGGTILLAGGTVLFQGGYSGSGEVIDGAHPGGIIIDNGDEGTSFTGTWGVSGTPGFYGENSRYVWKQEGLSYSFEAWALGAREVSLWWNAYPNRSTNVSVEIYNGGDLLDTVTVNQRNNGGKWNPLGYYSFTDEAEVRIVSPGSGATIADAVKFGPSNEIVIDNDGEGTSSTGSWGISGTPGFYGENSRYVWKQKGASYSFEAQILGDYQVSLWWNAYANRATNVTVEIYDGGTLHDTVTVNQTTNGSKWNVLGTYPFSYGAKVKIISPGIGATIADAVKFTPF